jgi:hypothetical protein
MMRKCTKNRTGLSCADVKTAFGILSQYQITYQYSNQKKHSTVTSEVLRLRHELITSTTTTGKTNSRETKTIQST